MPESTENEGLQNFRLITRLECILQTRIFHFKARSVKSRQLENSFSFHCTPSLIIFAAVLKECFKTRESSQTTILCNGMKEVEAVKYSLKRMKIDNSPTLRISYLSGDNDNDNDNEDDLDEHVTLTDYRSFRGCEAIHGIILVDPSHHMAANVLVEKITRTIAYLDIISLPVKTSENVMAPHPAN